MGNYKYLLLGIVFLLVSTIGFSIIYPTYPPSSICSYSYNNGTYTDFAQFNTTYNGTTNIGKLMWDSTHNTLEFGLSDNVNLQIGQEMLLYARNTNGNISNGQVVYVNGSTGHYPEIYLADADFYNQSYVIGVATEDIGHNEWGYVTTTGEVHDVNTDGMIEGQPIWLSQTTGEFTQTKPIAPAMSVFIGYVLYANANNGIILVNTNIIPRLQQLSDVYGTPTTTGEYYVYNSTSKRFELKNYTATDLSNYYNKTETYNKTEVNSTFLKLDQSTQQTVTGQPKFNTGFDISTNVDVSSSSFVANGIGTNPYTIGFSDISKRTLFGGYVGSSYGSYMQMFGANFSEFGGDTRKGSAEFVLDSRYQNPTRFTIFDYNGVSWTERFIMTSAGKFGMGIVSPIDDFHIFRSTTQTTPQIFIEQDGTGDASVEMGIVGDSYIMGIDNSDSDKFKISYSSTQGGAVLGTNDRVVINENGSVDILGNLTAPNICYANGTNCTSTFNSTNYYTKTEVNNSFIPYVGANKSIDLGNNSVIIGSNTTSGGNLTILGSVYSTYFYPNFEFNSKLGSLSAGLNTKSTGYGNIAMGINGENYFNPNYTVEATGSFGSIALGGRSKANYAIAIGSRTLANAQYSTTIGYDSRTYATNSLSIGKGAFSYLGDGVSIGTGTSSNGLASLTIGYYSNSTGSQSLSIGAGTKTNNSDAIAIGNSLNVVSYGYFQNNKTRSILFGFKENTTKQWDLLEAEMSKGVRVGATTGENITMNGNDLYVDGEAEIGSNLYISANNDKLLFGTNKAMSLYYDGNNAIINPKEVGSGNLNVLGGINQTLGNATINNLYGEMYNKQDNGFEVVDLIAVDTYVQVKNLSCGENNGFTCSGGNLTAQVQGLYKVDVTMSVSDGAVGEHGFKLYLNETGLNNCYNHKHATTNTEPLSFSCFARINSTHNKISVRIDDHANPVNDLTLYAMNVNAVRIGN